MDISQAFVVTQATFNSYANYLIRVVPMNSSQMCQMTCYFQTDCHFVVRISTTICGIGNFKLTHLANLTSLDTALVSVYKGN